MGKKVKRIAKDYLSIQTLGLSNVIDKKLNPDLPEQPTIPTAPVADEEALQKANRRALSRKRAGRGRAGTLLSEGTSLG